MKVIRCNNNKPTPYLRKHLPKLKVPEINQAVDLGCGNLRNTKFARELGWFVFPIDGAGDNGSVKLDLGEEIIPLKDGSVDLVLCNYVLCFLNKQQREHLLSQVKRITKTGSYIFVEMAEVKDGCSYDIKEIVDFLGWEVLNLSKHRFIARRG